MIRTQIQLTEDQDRALEALAASDDVSKAEMVRRAVNLLLERRRAAVGDADRRARALSIIGSFRGDGQNVSEDHDTHLAASYSADIERGRSPLKTRRRR